MASPRRIGGPDSKNRSVLLDAAERLMLEEGYAAVSSRSVARRAGLKSQLFWYYFKTMDDLFLAVFQRRAEEGLARHAEILKSSDPLRALWEFNLQAAASGVLTMEFAALANHRAVVREVLADYSERFRAAEIAVMDTLLRRYEIDTDEWPAAVVAFGFASVSRTMVFEQALGMTGAHQETMAFVEQRLRRLGPVPPEGA